ncbi:hypothetical protein [Bartonella sp. DGB1]|uniref:hypothetical protein n=1 Tax=Bartonella sp. DGB1 TaxID=3239807 RepID=UPI003526A516
MKTLKYLILALSLLTAVTPASAKLSDAALLFIEKTCAFKAVPAGDFKTFEECMKHLVPN